METRLFLLGPGKRARRRWRRDLIRFLDALNLYLYCGYDLGFSWEQAHGVLCDELSPTIATSLRPRAEDTPALFLQRLATEYPDAPHRVWFWALRELYLQGAPLAPAVESFSRQLSQEEGRELAQHLRELPTKLNLTLILFYLPPTLTLLFFPLVLEFLRVF